MQKVTILQKICRGILNRMVYILPDKWFLFLRFRNEVGYWPHLNDPRTFNEKLQWLKLHDIHPEYTQMVDKIEAKKYVASKFGGGGERPRTSAYNSELLQSESLAEVSCPVSSKVGPFLGRLNSHISKDAYKLKVEELKTDVLGRAGGGVNILSQH